MIHIFAFKRSLVFGLITILFTNLYGQSSLPASMATVIPPSPNAAAFAKYGSIPVSLYTGVPVIDIPLYEINVRDIKVPISLSYHASGIKVGEESSRIGLGFVLNAGGMISRNIINRDDFQNLPNAFLSGLNSSPAIPQGPNFPPASGVQGGTMYGYYSTQSSQSGTPLFLDLTSYLLPTGIDPLFKAHDFEPDQFTYNFNGHAGRFVLNKNREVILEKQDKIRIRPLDVNGSTWEVTTSDGFVYKFLDSEYFIDYNNTPGYQQKSGWYLSEIISPQHEHVRFYYNTEAQKYIIPVGSFYERTAPNVISCSNNVNCGGQNSYRHPIVGKNYSNISLDRIEWSHGMVKFNVAEDRLDIEGDKRITSIQIFKEGEADPFEEIVFDQDYFTSSLMGSEFPTSATSTNAAIKRLKLNGFTKQSVPATASLPEHYSFSYYEDVKLPPKNSFARDHWGYANGNYGNSSLIPNYLSVVGSTTTLEDIMGVMEQERDPSFSNMRAFTLQSITYPTKGYTTFSYSANEYEAAVGSSGGNKLESYSESTPILYDARNKGVVQTIPLDLRDEYVNHSGHVVPVTVSAAFRTNMSVACDQMTPPQNVYFELFDASNNSFGHITPGDCHCTPNTSQYVFTYSASLTLPPGMYYWKAYMPSNEVQIVDISAMYTWIVDAIKRPKPVVGADGVIQKFRTAGGLRISEIVDNDTERADYKVKKYSYGYGKTNAQGVLEAHSYGRLMVQPDYSYYDVSWVEEVSNGRSDICLQCLTLIRDSGHPQANYTDNPVGYDKVVEYQGPGFHGRTEYQFENVVNEIKTYKYPYSTDNIPIQPPFSNSVKNPGNGNLLRQTDFTADGIKIRTIENKYRSDYRNVMYGLSSREITVKGNIATPTAPFLLLAYETMNSNFPYLSETMVTSYLPTGTDNEVMESNKVRTEYYYNNSEHLQLTKQVTYESNKHKTITNFTYPADYTDAQSTAAIMDMKGSKFMHSLPVETTILDEAPDGTQKIKHREFTVYDNFGTFTFPKEKVVLQSSTWLSPADASPYIPVNAYDPQLYKKAYSLDYNTTGNLMKIQKADDLPVSYLWGHQATLPIAEIKNANAADCFVTSFEEGGNLFADASGLNLARTGRRVLNSNTYTFPQQLDESNTLMSYWYWQNNQWNFTGVIPFQRTFTTTGSRLDEIRAFPKDVQMTTFTYLPMIGMSSQTDANNNTLYYQYDLMGRLKVIRDHNNKILKSYEYVYTK